ncbi:DUF4386 domain-containing protein [Tropicimonas marinistellae]|uniref:DUF4386 domain-containing protein n=1 Tax=Tropicimonas marinistellae TaxID=1739787 RepID=UPI0013735920|nr:DUF4386 domain-containing protein [Tropicimonas marinistellae]
MSNASFSPDRATAVVLVLHIVAMFGGFMVLGPAFDFPEVLRYPAPERFAIFAQNQSVIRPTYWVLTMTGMTQILISVLLFHAIRAQSQLAATLSLIFGTLAGFCQALGFGRWVILIPYFVAEAADPEKAQMAAMLEGAFNHYAGILVGEHLANICWGVWLATICVAFLNATNLNRPLALFGIALAPLLFLLAGEQVGVSGDILDPLVDFGFPLLAVWHVLLAAQLWSRNGATDFSNLGRGAWIAGGLVAAGMITPALA